MDPFTICLDAPGEPAKRLQVAKLGSFTDPRYGDLSITEDDVNKWAENLSVLPGGRALIDLDHRADKSGAARSTEAAGWITGLSMADGVPMADVEWTPVGEKAIAEKRYAFFSPSYGDFQNDSGLHHDVLTGGALTNKPFLNMPTVQLAQAEAVERALEDDENASLRKVLLSVDATERKQALKEGNSLPDGSYPIRNTAQLHAAAILAASGHGDAAAAKKLIQRRAKELGVDHKTLPGFGKTTMDSPPPMALITKESLSALGIEDEKVQTVLLEQAEKAETPEQASAVLAAVTEATPKADPEPEPNVKTFEQMVSERKLVALDQGEYERLQAGSAAGAQSQVELRQIKFDTAFETACDEGRAVGGDREFYEKLPLDVSLPRLLEAPVMVNVKPTGKDVPSAQLEAPPGVDAASYQLDQQARKLMAEDKDLDYVDAVHAVEDGRVGA
jgi:phage I-like protein